MTAPDLAFLQNEAGEKEGLGDAGIETFRNEPYASAAREAGQNSRDAEETLPVMLKFDVLRLSHDQIPAYDRLVQTLDSCAQAAEQEKEVEFFANAIAVVSQPLVPVLRIADFNTRGLKGPADQAGTPFHSLLKSSGVSTKESETSGGSFGIGKNASFAVSDLQMVMYSTLYKDATGSDAFAAQGKIKLVSHLDSDGISRRATGYWGAPSGFAAVTDPRLVPDWLRRDTQGTSIFCMGFREAAGWAERMTSSLVANFFCAVHRREMVFDVASGQHEVNENTVEALLSRPDIRDAAERSGQRQDLDFSEKLYRCLVSPLSEERIITVPNLGDFRVRVLVDAGMPRRIGFIRNGMYITDNLRHFGQPLQRFPGSRDFVALVEPVGGSSEKLLKRLENPAHDDLSAARIADPVKRAAAEVAMKKLGRHLRELIRQTTGVANQDSVVLDELGRYFSQPADDHAPPGEQGERDPESHRFTPPKRKPVRKVVPQPNVGEEGGARRSGGGGSGGGSGPGTGLGTNGRGQRATGEPVLLLDVRNVRSARNGRSGRRLYVTPDFEGHISLSVEATGVNETVMLSLIDADQGQIQNGRLVLEVSRGKRLDVTVTFSEPYDGPVEVVAVSATPATGGAA